MLEEINAIKEALLGIGEMGQEAFIWYLVYKIVSTVLGYATGIFIALVVARIITGIINSVLKYDEFIIMLGGNPDSWASNNVKQLRKLIEQLIERL